MTPHIVTRGNGPDLVLLHGWGMNAAVWEDIAAGLAGHFRVHCVDLPGHGESGACAPYTLDALADTLAAALPPRLMVCGWSLGGQIALNWARRAPHRIDRLVLIATTPRFVRDDGWECGIDVEVLDGFAHDLARDYHGTLQRFLALQARGDADMHAVLRRLRERMLTQGAPDVAALGAGLRLLKEIDLRGDLPHVPSPVLVMHGERDALVPLAAGRYLQRALPNAALEVLAGAAHAPFVTHAERSTRSIVEFCNGR